MKAGIMEIPHIAAVTKADLGAAALRAVVDVEGALGLVPESGSDWKIRVLPLSAVTGDGVGRLIAAIDEHRTWLSIDDRLGSVRHAGAKSWLEDAVMLGFGEDGIARAGDALLLGRDESPFARQHEIAAAIRGTR